ncbi:MAG: type II toxin-antitoxin system VapC family toxin [Nitriliruptoraceae bacterium]
MIVLDASALLDVLLDQPDRGWVLDRLSGEHVCAPAHQLAEVLSAVARLVHAGEVDPAQAGTLVEEAAALQQELVVPSAEHLRAALTLQARVRVLDGLYVALAQERGVPLVTSDRRLAGAQLPVTVLVPDEPRPG